MINSEQWLAHPGSVGRAADRGAARLRRRRRASCRPARSARSTSSARSSRERRSSTTTTRRRRRPRSTREHPNWTTVGDLGYLDDDGYLYLTDRKAFMIISGGREHLPAGDRGPLHPAPGRARHRRDRRAGRRDGGAGRRLRAAGARVVEADDALAAELTAYARERIAHFKVPREIHFRDELPRTPTGKMVKGRLQRRVRRRPPG